MVRWQDDPLAYDTMPAKDIVPPEGTDVLNVKVGTKCSAVFKGKEFGVDIVASGKANTCMCGRWLSFLFHTYVYKRRVWSVEARC